MATLLQVGFKLITTESDSQSTIQLNYLDLLYYKFSPVKLVPKIELSGHNCKQIAAYVLPMEDDLKLSSREIQMIMKLNRVWDGVGLYVW